QSGPRAGRQALHDRALRHGRAPERLALAQRDQPGADGDLGHGPLPRDPLQVVRAEAGVRDPLVPEVRVAWFETPGERRAFLLVWGGVAALGVWYFFFGPRAGYDYNWRWSVVWQYRRFLLWGMGTTLYIFAWSLAF